MTREEKSTVIADLTTLLGESKVIYLADISAMNAEQTSNLRRACFKANVKLAVVKNTLLSKAIDNTTDKDLNELKSALKGNTALMLAEVGNAPAKIIKEFRSKKSEKPVLKGAFIEENIYLGDDQLDTLASIKSREELIGDIIGLLQSPARNIISALTNFEGRGLSEAAE